MSQEQNIPHDKKVEDEVKEKTPTQSKPKPQSQPPTSNIEPQTTNMEVHKHPHHVTHKKKWGEYVLEFLMLFLAVFLGFIAENQREHIVEHQREKQYIKSLKEDVAGDINQIGKLEIELHDFISRLDSIAGDLNQFNTAGPSLVTCEQISRSMGFSDFIYTDRTIQQLKNAGGMRLIRNSMVADSIVEYDAIVRRGLVHQDLINTLYLPRTVDKINYAFNITEINKIAAIDIAKADTDNLKKSILLTYDKTELIRVINEIRHYRFMIDLQLNYITRNRDLALRLLALLKKEYHLK
jgi:hypothetical protein